MTLLVASENYKEMNGRYPKVKVIKENGFFCLNDIIKPFAGVKLSLVLKIVEPLAVVVTKETGSESIMVKEGRSGGFYAHPAICHAVNALISPEEFYKMICKVDTFYDSNQSDKKELEYRRTEDNVYSQIRKKEKNQSVYVIKDNDTGHIKIGISDNPEGRIKAFSCGSVSVFSLVYKTGKISKDDARDIESQIHKIYANKNVRGEWFSSDIESDVVDILGMDYQTRKEKLIEMFEKRNKQGNLL